MPWFEFKSLELQYNMLCLVHVRGDDLDGMTREGENYWVNLILVINDIGNLYLN